MEELRRAAVAYYNNSSKEFQDMAWNFFQSMDLDRNGRVSFDEFTQFLHYNGYNWFDRHWFPHLDANRDGGLDFWEVLTFYYALKTRAVWCGCCCAPLHGLYFTCVDCFDGGGASYDLCSDCYSARNFHHHHGLFLDSYVLLRSKRKISPGADLTQAITQPQNHHRPNFTNYCWTALEMALSVGNLAASLAGCSIM